MIIHNIIQKSDGKQFLETNITLKKETNLDGDDPNYIHSIKCYNEKELQNYLNNLIEGIK